MVANIVDERLYRNMNDHDHRRRSFLLSSCLQCALSMRNVLAVLVLVGLVFKAFGETDPAYGRLITSLAVAVNSSTQKVYAIDETADMVCVIDEQTGSTHAIKVGSGPIALAINRVTNRIYVVNTNSDSISVIDGKQDAVIATIRNSGISHPYVLAVNETTNKVYVTNTYSNAITVIDGVTNIAQQLKTGSADGIAIDPRTNAVFLMTYEDPDVRIVDANRGGVNKVRVGAHNWGIAFDEPLQTLYLAQTGIGDLIALNETTHAVKSIPIGSFPCAVAVNPITQMLYAVNYDDETVSVINARTNRVVATLHVGKHPQAVAVDSLRNRMYVANVHGNSVTVVDGTKNTVIGTYYAGRNPYALAVDPETGHVYAANYGEPAVTAIDLPRATALK
jgi:YVTN family beta-propeller protein